MAQPQQIVFGFAEHFRYALEERKGVTWPQIYGKSWIVTHDCASYKRVATGIGGFTGGGEVMTLTQAHGRKAEVQSWGYTLTQAANLHLMLAHANCDRFEQATPAEKYAFGARQGIRPDADGLVRPSGLPDLSVELDRDAIEPFVYARRDFAR